MCARRQGKPRLCAVARIETQHYVSTGNCGASRASLERYTCGRRPSASDEATTRLTPPQSRPAEELARRLLARDAPAEDAPDAVAAAAERVCGRVSANLSRWFGIDGTDALFARAVARAQADHPALANVRYSHQSAVCLERLAESARRHGAHAAADGVAAVLTVLIELLGRLIGEDIAMRLLEQSGPAAALDDARGTGQEDQQ